MKKILDAIIDEELDAKALAQKAYEEGDATKLTAIARNVTKARVVGKMNTVSARDALRLAFVAVVLNQLAETVGEIAKVEDVALSAMKTASKEYGKPIATLPAVRNADIKARENEKREPNGNA